MGNRKKLNKILIVVESNYEELAFARKKIKINFFLYKYSLLTDFKFSTNSIEYIDYCLVCKKLVDNNHITQTHTDKIFQWENRTSANLRDKISIFSITEKLLGKTLSHIPLRLFELESKEKTDLRKFCLISKFYKENEELETLCDDINQTYNLIESKSLNEFLSKAGKTKEQMKKEIIDFEKQFD